MSHRTRFVALAVPVLPVAVLAVLALPALAAKGRKVDLVTTAPDFASYGVHRIAMLPVATYDRNVQAEHAVAGRCGQNLRDAGYRWISALTTREMMQSAFGDSTVKAVREEILKAVRVDSLLAPVLCAKLRTDAVLCVRVDQWEQLQVLWNQPGRPATTVQLKAALVDSTGTLLWSISGSETGEGPYHDPSANPIGVNSSNLENTPVTGQGGPPSFDDVLNRLFVRWAPLLPRPAEAAEPAK